MEVVVALGLATSSGLYENRIPPNNERVAEPPSLAWS